MVAKWVSIDDLLSSVKIGRKKLEQNVKSGRILGQDGRIPRGLALSLVQQTIAAGGYDNILTNLEAVAVINENRMGVGGQELPPIQLEEFEDILGSGLPISAKSYKGEYLKYAEGNVYFTDRALMKYVVEAEFVPGKTQCINIGEQLVLRKAVLELNQIMNPKSGTKVYENDAKGNGAKRKKGAGPDEPKHPAPPPVTTPKAIPEPIRSYPLLFYHVPNHPPIATVNSILYKNRGTAIYVGVGKDDLLSRVIDADLQQPPVPKKVVIEFWYGQQDYHVVIFQPTDMTKFSADFPGINYMSAKQNLSYPQVLRMVAYELQTRQGSEQIIRSPYEPNWAEALIRLLPKVVSN